MMRKLIGTAVIIAIAVVACASRRDFGPVDLYPMPKDTIRFPAPPQYVEWWGEVERCVGVGKPYYGVRWYAVKADRVAGFSANGFNGVAGVALPSHNAIVLGMPWVFDSAIVAHEMAHLVGSAGYHDPTIFQGRCKYLVGCWRECLTDTVPPSRRRQ